MFRRLAALDIHRLQCVQNSLTRIVYNTAKFSHITPVTKTLSWLPIKHRSVFKMALKRHFGLSFVYDTPRIWNHLPDDNTHPNLSLHSESLKPISLQKHTHPHSLVLSRSFSMVLTLQYFLLNDYGSLLSGILCLRVY